MMVGRTKIKVTLAGSLVYYFDAWVGDQAGQEAILGMDFMVPAGNRLDLADGTLCLPDEVRIHLAGRRPPYGAAVRMINADDQFVVIPVGDSAEVKIGRSTAKAKLWVARDEKWVPTVISGPGQVKYLRLTNLTDEEVVLRSGFSLGMWMPPDMIPRTPGFVSVGSRCYNEWQTLAFESTVDRKEEMPEESTEPMVEHPSYTTPTKILRRHENEKVCEAAEVEKRNRDRAISASIQRPSNNPERNRDRAIAASIQKPSNNPERNRDRAIVASLQTPSDIPRQPDLPDAIVGDSNEVASETNVPEESDQGLELLHQLEVTQNDLDKKGIDEIDKIDKIDHVYYHDQGGLFAEDVDQHMAVLPEVVVPGGGDYDRRCTSRRSRYTSHGGSERTSTTDLEKSSPIDGSWKCTSSRSSRSNM